MITLPRETQCEIIQFMDARSQARLREVCKLLKILVDSIIKDIDLHTAINRSDYASFTYLMKSKVYKPRELDHGLYLASLRGANIAIIDILIDSCSDLNFGLCGACEGGNIFIVQYLLDKGASDVNLGFIRACERGHLPIVKLMIKLGANVPSEGLRFAQLGEHSSIIQFLTIQNLSRLDLNSLFL